MFFGSTTFSFGVRFFFFSLTIFSAVVDDAPKIVRISVVGRIELAS
jgi:hypothetical protein